MPNDTGTVRSERRRGPSGRARSWRSRRPAGLVARNDFPTPVRREGPDPVGRRAGSALECLDCGACDRSVVAGDHVTEVSKPCQVSLQLSYRSDGHPGERSTPPPRTDRSSRATREDRSA
jgi:hypothetical protein